MQNQYYISIDGKMDGPHDLVTIMRRVRAGKITPNTQIMSDAAAAPLPASFIPEIAGFFDQKTLPSSGRQKTDGATAGASISALISAGWRFTMEHNIMTVYAGALLLISIMLALVLSSVFGTLGAGLISWCVIYLFQSTYLLFVLRLHRGQILGTEFASQHLLPILGSLLVSGVVSALLIAIGGVVAGLLPSVLGLAPTDVVMQTIMVALTIIPGALLATFCIFTPFVILDQHASPFAALRTSFRLAGRQSYFGTVGSLVFFQVLCLILIIPTPLTLPIFAAALSQLYEDISAA